MESTWSPGAVAGSTTPAATEQVVVPFRVLGPLEVGDPAAPVDLRGTRVRRLLARLLLHPGGVVSVNHLIDAVWDGEPPASAEVTLRSHVATLRRAVLAAGIETPVVTRPHGYLLQVAPQQVDARRFEKGIAGGRAALERGDVTVAAHALRDALGLWRGPLLQDLGPPRFAEAEAARLEELRLTGLEARVDADLASGRHRELVGELEAAVGAHPFRERFYGQLMLALYRSDRQAEALEVYQDARRRLSDELGLEPGRSLAELETAILRQDPALLSGPGATAASPPAIRVGARPSASGSATLLDVMRRQPMVGRAAELERLTALWQAVRDGGSRVVLLAGEAGAGKTRLAAELAAHATAGRAIVLLGHCEQAAAIPYAPVTDALSGSAEVADAYTRVPAPVQHLLAALVQRPAESRGGDPPAPDDPHERQLALFTAVNELVASVAGRAPTLLVVDDAESLDAASARLLAHLARHLPARLLLVVCFRDPPGSRHAPLRAFLADVGRGGVADRLDLGPLPETELAELVAAWSGQPASPDLVHALWSSTGGNPFYAGAVVEELMTRGGLDAAEAAWRVPTGVRDMLRERLRDLSAAARDVVGCAAVLGREMAFDLLVRVADRLEHEVVAALEESIAAGWLAESGNAWEAGYAFRHALMREAVHADLPAPHRQRLHLRAATALEEAGLARPAEVAAAAVHLRSSGPFGDRERAASLSLEAAEAAAQVYAWDEAVTHAEAAVAILASINAAPALQADAVRRAAELLITSTLDLPRAVRHFEAALTHYRAAGDDAAVAAVRSRLGFVLSYHHSVMDIPRALEHFAAAEAMLTDGEAAFHLQFGIALATVIGLRTDQSRVASARAVEIAQNLKRRDLVALVGPTQAASRFGAGELAAGLAALDDAWEVARELGDPRLGWEVTSVGAMLNTVFLLDPEASRMWCERAFAQPRLERLALPLEVITDQFVHALAVEGDLGAARERAAELPDDAVSRRLLLLCDGDWETAEQSWSEARDRDLGRGDLVNASLNAYWAGQARWLLDRPEQALEALRQSLEICLAGPQLLGELMARAEMARYLAAHGDVDEADVHLVRCDEILGAGEDWRGRAGHVELARATVAGVRGRHGDADAAYTQALEVLTAYRLPWWRAETLLAWARTDETANRPGDAESKRTAALEIYAELGAHDRWCRRR
ncbi:BTAD domain-containing putative transcriptional regulator [Nitriliruptor alkaliphilus]|uniref:BTAD domain-containing putative transcriptional regulator n=1 Tax=Nitriliruptor alkaliphilus TaxID=427918 RepID=UPI0006985C6B|nr:BTAD domain-containing putative transcriptional regulator [Nitriliruptor alkaliphilus]